MKRCSKCGQSKAESEFYRNAQQRSGLHPSCKECNKPMQAAYRARNRAALSASQCAWQRRNRRRATEKSNRWAKTNPEKIKATARRWRQRNKSKTNVFTAHYRATKLRATPAWANEFFIDEAYHLAALRTKHTGIEWHVDHIVPLKSKRVCGLHVETNLRVVPARVNRVKSNRLWPDMPESRGSI